MDNLLKAIFFISLIMFSLNGFAYREILAKNVGYSCCNYYEKSSVHYSGPDCNGYYYGSDCSKVIWIGSHWDVYGHYIPGYWLALNR